MNKNINYLLENILADIDTISNDDSYDIEQQYLYKYHPKTKNELDLG